MFGWCEETLSETIGKAFELTSDCAALGEGVDHCSAVLVYGS